MQLGSSILFRQVKTAAEFFMFDQSHHQLIALVDTIDRSCSVKQAGATVL